MLGATASGFSTGDFPLLTALIVTPLIGAVLTLFISPRRADTSRIVGLIASFATLGLAVWLLVDFEPMSVTNGRGMTRATIHSHDGVLGATVQQELLMRELRDGARSHQPGPPERL